MDLSATSRARVAVGTAAATLFCIVVTVTVDSLSYGDFTDAQLRVGLRNAVLIPLFLGGSFFYLLLSKMRALALAKQELQRIASTDGLTTVLNKAAFSTLVEAYLLELKKSGVFREGALLMVDADYFKKINDTYGHQVGDEALRRIARSIKAVIRDNDLVGRVGGEEFGVFLPHTSIETARGIAERIRLSVRELPLQENSLQERLSVSIGGTAFSSPSAYDNLFSQADKNLYVAKAAGRNKTVVSYFQPNHEPDVA